MLSCEGACGLKLKDLSAFSLLFFDVAKLELRRHLEIDIEVFLVGAGYRVKTIWWSTYNI